MRRMRLAWRRHVRTRRGTSERRRRCGSRDGCTSGGPRSALTASVAWREHVLFLTNIGRRCLLHLFGGESGLRRTESTYRSGIIEGRWRSTLSSTSIAVHWEGGCSSTVTWTGRGRRGRCGYTGVTVRRDPHRCLLCNPLKLSKGLGNRILILRSCRVFLRQFLASIRRSYIKHVVADIELKVCTRICWVWFRGRRWTSVEAQILRL